MTNSSGCLGETVRGVCGTRGMKKSAGRALRALSEADEPAHLVDERREVDDALLTAVPLVRTEDAIAVGLGRRHRAERLRVVLDVVLRAEEARGVGRDDARELSFLCEKERA